MSTNAAGSVSAAELRRRVRAVEALRAKTRETAAANVLTTREAAIKAVRAKEEADAAAWEAARSPCGGSTTTRIWSRICCRRGHDPLNDCHDFGVRGLQEVPVPVDGGGDRLVSESGLDHGQRDLASAAPGSVGVAEAVNTRPLGKAGEIGSIQGGLPAVGVARPGVPGATFRGREDESDGFLPGQRRWNS